MDNEEEYLLRSNKNRRRKTKDKQDSTNRLVNILIVVVSVLIIISITLILTNSDLKNSVKKSDEQGSGVITEDNEQTKDDSTNEEGTKDKGTEQQGDNQNSEQNESEENNEQVEESEETTEDPSNSVEEELQYITTVATEDPNVIVAFVDSRWTPYPTAQTEAHVNVFDVNHNDYKEKLQLLYRDTGFTQDTSILWSIRNKSGDAVAVISAKNKTNIFRLTMKWIDGQGWQTILVEQLHSLEGAY